MGHYLIYKSPLTSGNINTHLCLMAVCAVFIPITGYYLFVSHALLHHCHGDLGRSDACKSSPRKLSSRKLCEHSIHLKLHRISYRFPVCIITCHESRRSDFLILFVPGFRYSLRNIPPANRISRNFLRHKSIVDLHVYARLITSKGKRHEHLLLRRIQKIGCPRKAVMIDYLVGGIKCLQHDPYIIVVNFCILY